MCVCVCVAGGKCGIIIFDTDLGVLCVFVCVRGWGGGGGPKISGETGVINFSVTQIKMYHPPGRAHPHLIINDSSFMYS